MRRTQITMWLYVVYDVCVYVSVCVFLEVSDKIVVQNTHVLFTLHSSSRKAIVEAWMDCWARKAERR